MKAPYLVFLAWVVLPTAAAMGGALEIARRATSEQDAASLVRVADMVLGATDAEIAGSADSLMRAAPSLDPATLPPALARAARRGDTVMGFSVEDSGLLVSVAVPDGEGVRGGRAPLSAGFVGSLGAVTGRPIGVYVSGRRWAATADGFPGVLPTRLLRELAEAPGHVSEDGILYRARHDGSRATPAVVAAARPGRAAAPPFTGRVLLVLGLALVFSAVAAWIQFAAPGCAARPPGAGSFALLALVPLLATVALLLHLDRTVEGHVETRQAGDLARALAVAQVRGLASSPARVSRLTGYEAARVRGGRVEASTWTGNDLAGIAAVPPPPPSYTTSGEVVTPEGAATYVALRLPGGGFAVVTEPAPEALHARRRRLLAWIGAGLALWVAGVTTVAARRLGPRAPTAGAEAVSSGR